MTERILVTGGSGFIGSHLIEALSERAHSIMNIDIQPPQLPDYHRFWTPCDIKDLAAVTSILRDFAPTRVIHLAARANLEGRTVNDYPDNTVGTANMVTVANEIPSVALFVHTSTQYVVRPGTVPPTDTFLDPYTPYGESKALAEQTVRYHCQRPWVIIRPTNVWGPGHPSFPNELWYYLEKRYYFHPGYRPTPKYYGYVTNAVSQILSVALHSHPSAIAGSTWYVTDGSMDNAEWMNLFSIRLSGKPIRRIPTWCWRTIAVVGDILKKLRVRVPVNTDRLFRLTVPECLPEAMILHHSSTDELTLEEALDRSIDWYLSHRSSPARS